MHAHRQLSPSRSGVGNNGTTSPFRPTSNPRGSSMGSSSAAAGGGGGGPSMDPLLARYIALKRDIEGKKVGATTPSRYGDPEHSSSNRITATTPRGGNVSGVSTIGDARSILQSPRVGGGGGGGPSATTPHSSYHHHHHSGSASNSGLPVSSTTGDSGLSPALRKRLASRMDAEAGSSNAQVTRRGADYEVTELNSRLQQQQMELDDMLGKLQASERQLRHTKDALEKSEAIRSDLELDVATRLRETESAASNSRQMGSANLRLMEGRMAALKEQLDKKDDEIQQWILRTKEGERELDHRENQLQELRDALSGKERVAVEQALSADSHKNQVRKLREQLEEVAIGKRMKESKVTELEGTLRSKDIDIERLEMQLREGASGQKRQVVHLEGDVASLKDQLREMESLKGHMEGRVAELTLTLGAQEKELRDTVTKLETLRVRSAQDSIVVDESKFDLQSAKDTIARLRNDLQVAVEHNDSLEGEVEELQSERRARQMLEAQIQGMATAGERQREDLEHQRGRIEDVDRRNTQLQREVEVIPELKERISELNELVEGKNAVIDKQRQIERSLVAEVGELKTKVTALEEYREQAEKDADRTKYELESKNTHIDSLLEESKKIPSLHGEIESMRQTIHIKNKDLENLQNDITGWKTKCMEMDSDIEALLDVKKQFDELVATHRSLYSDLEERSKHLEQTRAQLDDSVQNLHSKDLEVHELNALLMEAEALTSRQQAQLADKVSLEGRLRQTSSELVSTRGELEQERERREDVKGRLQQKEEMYVLERQAKQEAEDRLAKIHDDFSVAQVEVGKSQVRQESLEKEIKRVSAECEQRRRDAEDAHDKLAIARKELSAAQSDLRETAFKNTHMSSDLDRYVDEVAKLQEVSKELRMKLQVAEERVVFLTPLEDRLRAAETQVGSMSQRLDDREADLADKEKALKNSRSVVAKLEGDVESLDKANARYRESKALTDRQMLIMESLERDDEAKAKQLMEKERDLSRLRERVTLLSADLDAERARKRSLEGRIKDLEKECERASTLDGQVAGLNQVVQQRNRSLEEERTSNNELRARLARGGLGGADQRSVSRSRSAVSPADVEAKLAIKDEIIKQMEADDRRRQEQLDETRHKLLRAEERLHKAEESLREHKGNLMAAELAWTQRYAKLEAAYDAACAACNDRPETDALRTELAEGKKRIQFLQDEVREKDREVRVLRNHVAASPDTTDYTRQMEAKVNNMTHQLEEKELELAVAVDNLTHLQRRAQINSMEREQSPVQSVEDEVSRWREQRRVQRQVRNSSPEVSTLHSPPHHTS